MREGRFRDDLLRRLQVVRIRVPPLRERRGDIRRLAEHFLARFAGGRRTLSPAAVAVLQAADWPGNVAQLERAMREVAAAVPAVGETVIEPRHFAQSLISGESGAPRSSTQSVLEDRRTVLLRALSSHGGNRTAAARSLGIGRATFYRWWRETGLGGPETKVPVE